MMVDKFKAKLRFYKENLKMSEIFHPVFDWWQALLAINYDLKNF